MHCISRYSSVFHPRIKTFISPIQLCFTHCKFCQYLVLDFANDTFVFPKIIMDFLNIDNRSKTLAVKEFEHLLYKYYSKFVKIFKKNPNKFDIRVSK